jgi:hypothetical protein
VLQLHILNKQEQKLAVTKNKTMNSTTIRANSKKDPSPKWDGAEEWTGEQFAARYREAMSYYNLEFSGKALKPKVIDWMSRAEFTKTDIQAFKNTKDWRSTLTMGAIASCLLKGMPAVHPEFNGGRNSAEWLKLSIARVIEEGAEDEAPEEEVKVKKVEAPVVSIQDRVREQAGDMSEEIDAAIDSYLVDSDNFNPANYKILSLLRSKQAKPAHARMIKSFFEFGHNELLELAGGSADEQLREAYSRHPRKNLKKLIEFYNNIMTACDQIAAEAKVLKKPRARKVKPAEELVKKIKFKVSDDKLGITSVPPSQLVRAQAAVVYNVKTRKIGYYISNTSEGLAVKGAGLTSFVEKSLQKTLRKPAEQLKEFKEQNTQKRFETWFTKNLKTTETQLNGRFSEDVVILKVYK